MFSTDVLMRDSDVADQTKAKSGLEPLIVRLYPNRLALLTLFPVFASACMIPEVMAQEAVFTDIKSGITTQKKERVLQLADAGSGGNEREQHKLKKVKFVNHRCSILMPRQFSRKFESEGTGAKVGSYAGYDYPHGTLTLICASVPQFCAASTLLIDRIAVDKRFVKEVKKSSECQHEGALGKQFEVITTGVRPHDSGRIQGFVSGQNLYLLSAFGSKPWLESSTVEQFFNSLEIDQDNK